MQILGYQLAIVVSLLIARFFGQRCLFAIACLWTIETIVLVFFAPLIVLQLIVIWISFWAILELTERSPADVMDESTNYDTSIRHAVDVVLNHSKRIQNTRRASEELGQDTVDKFNELYTPLLSRISEHQQKILKSARRSVKRGYFPPLEFMSLDNSNDIKKAYSILHLEHKEFLRNTRRQLLSDAELATIFCDVAKQLELINLRHILILPDRL